MLPAPACFFFNAVPKGAREQSECLLGSTCKDLSPEVPTAPWQLGRKGPTWLEHAVVIMNPLVAGWSVSVVKADTVLKPVVLGSLGFAAPGPIRPQGSCSSDEPLMAGEAGPFKA